MHCIHGGREGEREGERERERGERTVICRYCLVTLPLVALVAAHLNAGVIQVVTV